MTTQGIVADVQPFVNSKLPLHLKAVVARRIQSAAPRTYVDYLKTLDRVVENLENHGVFASEKNLNYALKQARPARGEISNQVLVKSLLDQQKLQRIFIKIKKEGCVSKLDKSEIEFLLQHPTANVRAFVSKYQAELERALEERFSEEIGQYLLKSTLL